MNPEAAEKIAIMMMHWEGLHAKYPRISAKKTPKDRIRTQAAPSSVYWLFTGGINRVKGLPRVSEMSFVKNSSCGNLCNVVGKYV
mmetsp:Transcript_25197/g.47017  ORF Transcript_25197/g.47017 Transcript_25197/m.47017 type:complete len:85 (+) Transcript_25197:558-812(+)